MPRVIVCDVNETLLDVGALEPHFKQAFGDGRVLQDWFANVLLYSEVATLAGPYSDFASIGGASLDMVASARGITLQSADRSRILQGILTLKDVSSLTIKGVFNYQACDDKLCFTPQSVPLTWTVTLRQLDRERAKP